MLRNPRRSRYYKALHSADLPGRLFSSTCSRTDHYKTLGVPPHATKAQIKSHFYQLSKRHHPDVSTDARSKDIFQAASEAYGILGDDRERRAYDRSLVQPQSQPAHHPYHPRPAPRTGPRATYAWEYSSRPRGSSASHGYHYPGPQHKRPGNARPGLEQDYSPPHPSTLYHNLNSDSHLRGSPRRRAEEEEQALQNVRRVSGLTRAVQVVVLIVVSASMFGGWGV